MEPAGEEVGMMPRFSLPSEAKTRKAERNEQNPATTPSLYRAPAYPRQAAARQPNARIARPFPTPGLLIGRDVRDTRFSE
jgi:hypothetical protein